VKKLFSVLVGALLASMSVAGIALADDTDDTTESMMLTPEVIVDPETGTIYIALPVNGELPVCGPEEPEDPEDPEVPEIAGDDEDPDDGDGEDPEAVVTYMPGDCIVFVIDHPSGKMHHGAIVSTVAKKLHPSMLNGIKKGEIMRWVAKTGKTDDGEDGDDDGEAKVKPEKPEKVKKEKPERGNSDKVKEDKPERGNSENAKNKAKPNRGRKNR